MNIVKKIIAEEIFTAQGYPTIQCTIELSSQKIIKSSIPAGFIAPQQAMQYAYDNNNRIIHQRMQQAIEYINTTIAPLLINQPINALLMDSQLMDLHATQTNDALGSNTTLVISMALFKAQAASENIELFEFLQSISGTKQAALPQPLISIFECRLLHATSNIKELLAFPAKNETHSYQEQLHNMIMLYHHVKKILELQKLPTSTGHFGSFTTQLSDFHELLNIINKAIQLLPQHNYQLGLNIDADNLHDPTTNTYTVNQQIMTPAMLIHTYEEILQTHHNIIYIQDALAAVDTTGWQQLSAQLQSNIYNAAGEIFGTNPMKIRWGIMKKIANMIIIKPEYIGTISQTLAAIDACKNNNKAFLIASDNFATNDAFVSDLAAGTGAVFLKAGAPFGSEHMTKYNRLLEIERLLQK